MEQEKLLSAIESILFISGEPIKKSKLVKIFSGQAKTEDVEKGIDALSEKYAGSASGLVLLRKGEEVQLASKAENSQYVEKMVKANFRILCRMPRWKLFQSSPIADRFQKPK